MGCVNSIFQFGTYRTKEGLPVEKTEPPIQVKTVEAPVTKPSDAPPSVEKKEHLPPLKIESSPRRENLPKPTVRPKYEVPQQIVEPQRAATPPAQITKPVVPQPPIEPVQVSTLHVELQSPSIKTTTELPKQQHQVAPFSAVSPSHTVKEGVKKVETVKEEITPTTRIVTQETITTTITEKQSVDTKKAIVQPMVQPRPQLQAQPLLDEEDEEEEEEEEDDWENEDITKSDQKHMEKAVVTIQAGVRGYLTRKALNQQKQDADRNKDGTLDDVSGATVLDEHQQTYSPKTPTKEESAQMVKDVAATVVENVIQLATQEVPEIVAKQQSSVLENENTDLLQEDFSQNQNSKPESDSHVFESASILNPEVQEHRADLIEGDMQHGFDGVMEFEEEDLSTDDEDSDNLENAATKIQASYRGYKVRRELKDKHGFDGPYGEKDGHHSLGVHKKISKKQNDNITKPSHVASQLTNSGDDVCSDALFVKEDFPEHQTLSEALFDDNLLESENSLTSIQPIISVNRMKPEDIVFEAITDFGEDTTRTNLRGFSGQGTFPKNNDSTSCTEGKIEGEIPFVMKDSLELYSELPDCNLETATPKINACGADVPSNEASQKVTKFEEPWPHVRKSSDQMDHGAVQYKEDDAENESSDSSQIDDNDVENDFLATSNSPWVVSPAYLSETLLPNDLNKTDEPNVDSKILNQQLTGPQRQDTAVSPEENMIHPSDDSLLLNFGSSENVDVSTTLLPQSQQQTSDYWLADSNLDAGQQDMLSFLGDTHPSLEVRSENLMIGQDLMGEETTASSQVNVPETPKELQNKPSNLSKAEKVSDNA